MKTPLRASKSYLFIPNATATGTQMGRKPVGWSPCTNGTAVTGTNSTMLRHMRSRSINPITPSMFRSAGSRARPPAPKHGQEVIDADPVAVGIAAGTAPGAE